MARDRTKLGDAEVQGWLKAHPGWERRGDEIRRTFTFADFAGSLAFVNRVGELAEAMDHHPDIDIRYSKVTLALVTHDAGGLTRRDTKLAEEADALAAT
jgi:4a-hydroxytetrahydrobiopterin dehydratase